jgi:hypothetical protein
MICEQQKHTSIVTLEIEMTCITRQLKYCKVQLKYPENITHNIKRTSCTHLHNKFTLVIVIPFVTGKALQLRQWIREVVEGKYKADKIWDRLLFKIPILLELACRCFTKVE